MTELKTLKDMIIANCWCEDPNDPKAPDQLYEDEVVEIKELKAEAVKWVKKYMYSIGVFLGKGDKHQAEHYQVLVGWLMMFFNLTEEDLKEGAGE